jgi:cell division protein FtsI/penicillin-binding protein 2
MSEHPVAGWRLVLLGTLFAGCALVLAYRLYSLQVREAPRYQALAQELHQQVRTLQPKRGDILDRHGHPLAVSVAYHDVYAHGPSVENPREVAERLAPLLGVDSKEIMERLDPTNPAPVRLASRVPAALSDRIVALRLPGVYLEQHYYRAYPQGSIAPQLLGFVGRDFVGLAGLELSLDGLLRGQPGKLQTERDTVGYEIPLGRRAYVPPRDGATVVLTIDRALQRIAEWELARTIEEQKASGGAVIIMDVRTGGILATASFPSYNLTDEVIFDPDRAAVYKPVTATNVYEPGSVMKIFTMAAAIEERLINPETTFECTGVATIDGATIRNWDFSAHGTETMREVLVHSCNVGTTYVARLLGPERLYAYLRRFGFGEPTGVELPGEVGGFFRTPEDPEWSNVDLATNSFGQGIAVTPMQLIAATAAIANDGVLMRPTLIQAIVEADGSRREIPPLPVRRVVSSETAHVLADMMVSVMEQDGLAKARVPGYVIAGKTGTADFPTATGYLQGRTYASHVGFAPAHNPRVAILVKIDAPEGQYGGVAAAPLFGRLARQVFVHLGIPPSKPVPEEPHVAHR